MASPPSANGPDAIEVHDLSMADREQAVPVIIDSFTGIYRWHAKRTLRSIPIARGAWSRGELVGVSLLEFLDPAVGYVYYLAVRAHRRRRGVAGRLLEDALTLFRDRGARVVFAAAEEDNLPSLRLFTSRGFRVTEPKETSWRDGGLGAWGLRSRMMVVHGEVLLGLRLRPEPSARLPG